MKEKMNKFAKVIYYLDRKGLFSKVSDTNYLKLLYFLKTGCVFNISNPKNFNEKLQWLKINDRNSLYTKLVDKYEVRTYISQLIGEEFLIPLLGVYDNFDDIDFDSLPNKFVIKCTHDSGSVIVCKDKENFNIEQARKKITRNLKRNYYYGSREWQYKNVKPRIIIEKYMIDDNYRELKDYKFFCFNGEPMLVQVDNDRFTNHRQNFYDIDWNFRDVMIHCSNNPDNLDKKPVNYEKMLDIVRLLSCNIPHVRIDLYNYNGKIYFGEITFHHMSGFAPFKTSQLNVEMGSWITIC